MKYLFRIFRLIMSLFSILIVFFDLLYMAFLFVRYGKVKDSQEMFLLECYLKYLKLW